MIFWDFFRFFQIFGFFYHFWQFLVFLGFLWIFWIFLGFLGFFRFFWIFLDFWIFRLLWIFGFFEIFGFFFGGDFFSFFGIFFKVTNVTTKSYRCYYWTPKNAKNGPKQHNKLFFCPKGKKTSAEGRSPPQELEVGPCSGPYPLVSLKTDV